MARSRTPRILIVDDDQNILEVISTGLEDAGYRVDTARNASEAVVKSESNIFNLALVDIRLPDTEGTKLLTKMKEARPEMVTIILTGYPSLQNAIEAVNNGADAYLLKPVRMKDLLNVVRGKLKKQEELYLYMLDE
jgi:DNA-binding NtrC family response regulator